jgi:methyl-accepting chemotaxis protein
LTSASPTSTSILSVLSIRVKLVLLAGVGAVLLVVMASYLLWQQYQTGYENRKVGIRQSVEVMSSVVDWAYKQEVAGTLTREQAQKQALQAVNDARYAGKEYFWINDMDVRLLTHPFRPDLNGKDVSNIKDPDGNPVFVAFVNTVKKDGSGYLSYLWPKPGQDKPVEKVSYVTGFKPWGWVIGSGLYMDDLRSDFIAKLTRAALAVFGAIALTVVIAVAISRSIIGPLQRAVAVARAVSQGQLESDVSTLARDETGQLLRSMGDMQTTLQAFNQAQKEMSRQHELGMIDYRMPVDHLAGAYREMGESINTLVASHIEVKMKIVDIVTGYVEGRLGVAMDRLPGQKARISDAMDRVQSAMMSAAEAAQTNLRIKLALDNVSLPVRIADDDGTVLYINNALRNVLNRDRDAFAKQISGFDPAKIVGGSISVFYKDPQAALARLRTLTGTAESQLELGGADVCVEYIRSDRRKG